jgi:ribokinase
MSAASAAGAATPVPARINIPGAAKVVDNSHFSPEQTEFSRAGRLGPANFLGTAGCPSAAPSPHLAGSPSAAPSPHLAESPNAIGHLSAANSPGAAASTDAADPLAARPDRADEAVDSRHSSPNQADFGRAVEVDPRGVVVVGSLNADLMIYCDRLPQPGETVNGSGFAISPGGKSANQAVAAGRLDASVRLIGAIGDDANGAMLLDSLSAAGVDASRVRRHPTEPTGVALISVDSAAENTIVIAPGANGTLDPEDVDPAAFTAAAVVCLCLEVPMATVVAAAAAGRAARALVVLNPSPYAPLPDDLVALVDVLLVNAHEASLFLDGAELPEPQALSDTSTAEAWGGVRRHFDSRGLPRVVVTLGRHGAVVLDSPSGTASYVPPTAVDAVDTTGAGDAFTGALASRLAAGDDLVTAARFASVAAAIATTGKGTQTAYPTAAAVRSRLHAGVR